MPIAFTAESPLAQGQYTPKGNPNNGCCLFQVVEKNNVRLLFPTPNNGIRLGMRCRPEMYSQFSTSSDVDQRCTASSVQVDTRYSVAWSSGSRFAFQFLRSKLCSVRVTYTKKTWYLVIIWFLPEANYIFINILYLVYTTTTTVCGAVHIFLSEADGNGERAF